MKKLGLLLSVATLPFNVFASTYNPCSPSETAQGTCFSCGQTCVARYTETVNPDESIKGTLTISGEGEMRFADRYPKGTIIAGYGGTTVTYDSNPYDYNTTLERYQTNAPWRDLDRSITDVIIEDGITNIAQGAFYNVSSIESVSIPDSVTQIEAAAFQQDFSLTNANLPSNLEQIGHAAFHNTSIETFVIPETLQKNDGSKLMWSNTHVFSSGALKDIIVDGNGYFEKDMLKGVNMANIMTIYCENSNMNCQSLQNDDELKDKLISYEKQGGVYILDGTYYLSADNMRQGNELEDKTAYACNRSLSECKRDVLEAKGICQGSSCDVFIQSDGQYMLKFGGKTYQDINALLKGDYVRRRIYTIEEANFVAGDKNRVSITYR